MNYFKGITIVYSLAFALVFTVSCQEKSTADTTQESVTEGESTYKEATFVEPAEFDKGRRKSSAVLLDVRMPQEFEQGHIEGAVNINFFDPNFKNQLLELDKSKKYYVYCKNDSRSERAAEFLLQNDYPEVVVLKGGYTAWKEAGLQ